MAIAEMRKLNIAAMGYDRDAVLDALQRTGAAEIKECNPFDGSEKLSVDLSETAAKLSEAEEALSILSAEIAARGKDRINKELLKDGFEVSYAQFVACGKESGDYDALVKEICGLNALRASLTAKLAACERAVRDAQIYAQFDENLSDYKDTDRVAVKLGTAELSAIDNLAAESAAMPLFMYREIARSDENALIVAAYHKSVAAEADGLLVQAGFTPRPDTDMTGGGYYAVRVAERDGVCAELKATGDKIFAHKDRLKSLKIYCDYLGYLLEKAEASGKMRKTERTFILEAYVPSDGEETVKRAIEGATGAVYYEFCDPAPDEVPPTLMRNNKVVKNFESVTNMYSAPNSREFDPNGIMSVFYSVFLGFIMADIGYGLLMAAGGAAIYFKCRRDGGLKRVAGVFAVGGILTMIWGVLFNSFFGLPLSFMPTLLPNAKDDMWTILGIKVPAVLIISMLLGCVHLCAGYFCKFIQCYRRGKVFDGVCDGLTWTVFTLGALLAVIGLVEEMQAPTLTVAGGIIAAAGLLAAMLTAGRKEKFVGKFTKGFGAAYGIINFISDVLSYARLYGLMLSGAVIAQVISGYVITGYNGSTPFFSTGNPALIILGVVILIVGHLFNIAMNLLGAYIHDARLQYVEFYGRFYEGEGELFAPLGSKQKYIYLARGGEKGALLI